MIHRYDMSFYELNEATNRYSIEVNFRTTADEVRDGFAKMLLGYVSAAIKERGFHVKKIMDEKPYRIIISNNNWIDGEWVILISFNNKENCFVLSKGFYNRDRDTVTVQSNEKCAGHSAAEIFRTIFNKMHSIKDEEPHHLGGLKGVKGKTGPQMGSIRPTQSYDNLTNQFTQSGRDKTGM